MAQKKQSGSITENPLAGTSFVNWIRVCWHGGGPQRKYTLRVLYVTVMTLVLAPLRWLQWLRFGRKIKAAEVDPSPVFIVGHYRSGTTYLQNLMTQDSQWGFVSTTQAVVPGAFLLGRGVRGLLSLFLSEKRPMDNMAQSPTLPEEPEHAVANTSPYSFYHGLCFPKRWRELTQRYLLMEGISDGVRGAVAKAYLAVMKAATLASSGRRLILKNPPDTARIEFLLELFPDAKFVHIYRNPYVMYPSIRNFYSASLRDWQLQDLSSAELEEHIFEIYDAMMTRFEDTKAMIPRGSLVEVRFEDLERNPLDQLRAVYTDLTLPGFDTAKPHFEEHIASQKHYKKNAYRLDQQTVDKISNRWGRFIEQWDYELPEKLRPV